MRDPAAELPANTSLLQIGTQFEWATYEPEWMHVCFFRHGHRFNWRWCLSKAVWRGARSLCLIILDVWWPEAASRYAHIGCRRWKALPTLSSALCLFWTSLLVYRALSRKLIVLQALNVMQKSFFFKIYLRRTPSLAMNPILKLWGMIVHSQPQRHLSATVTETDSKGKSSTASATSSPGNTKSIMHKSAPNYHPKFTY